MQPAEPENDETDDVPPICHGCGAVLTMGEGSFFVVRIEAVADPSPPRDRPEARTPSYDELLAAARDLSERELMDQVHRRLTLHLCRPCYAGWIENPVTPRGRR